MKRFRFRLAVVERATRARHEALRRELGETTAQMRDAERRAHDADTSACTTLRAVLDEARRGVAAGELALAGRIARRLRDESACWQERGAEARERRETLAGALRDTWRRLDALDRARARAQRAWRRERTRHEQREADELRPRHGGVVPPSLRRRDHAHD
ncbi:MAG: hypothetical protein Kow0062_22920 [Acidobacteriota bacterium]